MEFGGTAISPTINSGWDQAIYGVATGTVVNSGSNEYVYSGGTAIGTVVNNDNHGGLDVFSGGTAMSTTVNSESVLTVYGFASSSIVNSGGSEFVSGGTAIGTVVEVGGLVFNTAEPPAVPSSAAAVKSSAPPAPTTAHSFRAASRTCSAMPAAQRSWQARR